MLNQKPSDLGIGDISKKTESGFPGFGMNWSLGKINKLSNKLRK
jgi:hypothetical protein